MAAREREGSTASAVSTASDSAGSPPSASDPTVGGTLDDPSLVKSERIWLYRHDKDVRSLCTSNDISESQFISRLADIRSLEMCQFNYDHIRGLQHFPSLTSLCIVAQDITEIQHLECCPNLESLWIAETHITEIKNLSACTKLKRLYLYGNKIRKIENLDQLVQLELLWLSDNQITILENIDALTHLLELQLGNNGIAHIGEALNRNLNLQTLNIAGNRISSFREILYLTRLSQLNTLCLSDPNYADNPICSLCNYQTHVIYHLPNLKVLDTLEVNAESRKVINATVLKKRMYYNMRIKTIKRNTNFLINVARNMFSASEENLLHVLKNLDIRAKRAQKMDDDMKLMARYAPNLPSVSQLEEMRRRLRVLTVDKGVDLHLLRQRKSRLSDDISQHSDISIRKLLLELETGGNIRFEDSLQSTSDEVLASCQPLRDLVARSKALKSQDVHIHKVSRLHNRHLKNMLEMKLSNTRGDCEQYVHHLFFRCGLEDPDDLFSVAEYGFQDFAKESSSFGGALGVKFSNYFVFPPGYERNASPQNVRRDGKPDVFFGIIARAYLRNVCHVSSWMEGREADAIFRDYVGSNGREYLVTETRVVVPEFFVEFSLKQTSASTATKLEMEMVDIAYSNRLGHPEMPRELSKSLPSMSDRSGTTKDANVITLKELDEEYPEIAIFENKPFPTLKITMALLKKNEPVVDNLNLTATLINPFKSYQEVTTLKTLVLCDCQLTNLDDLAVLEQLETLDLSWNQLQSFSDFSKHPKLQTLDLSGNRISELQEVARILSKAPTLQTLDLKFNPVCELKGYRRYVIRVAPSSIQSLDGRHVPIIEKKASVDGQDTKLLERCSSMQPYLFRPLSVRTQKGPGSKAAQNQYWNNLSVPQSLTKCRPELITTLEMDSCELYDLDLLPTEMANLRWASFRNNNLSDVSKLKSFPKLEELALEKNQIRRFDALSGLNHLSRLDVSENKIATLDFATGFKCLSHLSVENNCMRTLRPFAKINSLMELYVGNNNINELFGVFPLKELSRLIILDLTGNAVCQLPQYRHFAIYHLGRLKILDGVAIQPKELSAAKEAYLGKLTTELLAEKIGHFGFKNICELDLRNCKIREIDCFKSCELRNLRRLNFDNNLLTTMDWFLGLVELKSLSLNSNRIERFLAPDSPILRQELFEQKTRNFFPYLEELYLGYNQVTRIAELNLFRMPQLKILFLHGNKISRIDGLDHLTGLMELVLDKNQIKMAEPSSFSSLINLRELHLRDNRLKTLASFDCLPSLQHIFLSNNRIHDLNEIERLKLPSLVEISLVSNPVTRKQLYRYTLIMKFPHVVYIDGREVTEEERYKAENIYLELGKEEALKVSVPVSAPPPAPTNTKQPIKITSVVLDGLEMKLSANNGPGGFISPFGRPN